LDMSPSGMPPVFLITFPVANSAVIIVKSELFASAF
jgi:hypothetical protein